MTKKKSSSRSEFGRGLCICLTKFAEHFENNMGIRRLWICDKWIKANKKTREKMLSSSPPDNLNYGFPHMQELRWFVESADKIWKGDYKKKLSHEIELFMHGASDHLYDIEVPKGKKWDKIRMKVKRLQSKGLQMGHGYLHKKVWILTDLGKMVELTRSIALDVDKIIGLKPDKGEF